MSSAAILGNHPRSKESGWRMEAVFGVRGSHLTGLALFSCSCCEAERCTVVTVLSHLICGSFIQPLAMGVADVPVSSHELLGKNMYSMYSVCNESTTRGKRGVLQIS